MHAPLLGLALALPAAGDDTVTFNRDVAPILWEHCAECHRPGEVGPFPLLTYRDAAKRAGFLKDVVTSRQMPPWKAEPGFGRFHGERRLTDEQVATIARWADEGAEEGDPADLPAPPTFADGWRLGKPDLVLEMPEAFEVPASGGDVFRCFVIPTGLAESRTVAAVEFRPGNRRVVHHALFFLDTTGRARRLDEADDGPGYRTFGGVGIAPTGSLGGWAPGFSPRPLPDGVGRLLEAGSDLVLQVHYHPGGKPETDRSSVGIYFTKSPARETKVIAPVILINRDLAIPPGDDDYRRTTSFTLPVDVHAYGIAPHMHWLGREMKVTARTPDGREVPLIWVKDWDFNWQNLYVFEAPVALPAGTTLELEATFDNSAANPRNPSRPPRLVRFGEQTTDEMCLCAVHVVPDRRDDGPALRRALLRYFLSDPRALRRLGRTGVR